MRHIPGTGKLLLSIAIAFILSTAFHGKCHAQDSKKTRILFLLDLSGSMWGDMGTKRKVDVAKNILSKMVDSLNDFPNLEMALRAYGHTAKRNEQDCKDTRLEVPFSLRNAEAIKKRIQDIQPSGTTPIAYSLSQAASDFPNSLAKNMIILITDGIEECKGDPCAVSKALQAQKIVVRPFVIGLGMSEDYAKYFECVGRYFSAKTEKDFTNVLSVVVTQALNNTTMQVNLNDIHGKPTETDVNMTFYNAKSGELVYNYYHTMNALGRPDTFAGDPLIRYNVLVHTTPAVMKTEVLLTPSKHNIINIDAPQGFLNLSVNAIDYYTLKAIVRKPNSSEIIYVQDFNTTHNYLVGTYDVEVLTLPRVKFDNFKINQDQTGKIEIPQAGKLEVTYANKSIASLYIIRNNKQEWVIDLEGGITMRKDLYYLQPGNYIVVYRPYDSKAVIDTKQKEFKILSGAFTTTILD